MFNVLFHKSTAHFLRGAFKEKKWKIRDIVPDGGGEGGRPWGSLSLTLFCLLKTDLITFFQMQIVIYFLKS